MINKSVTFFRNGTVKERLSYTPFGERRPANWSLPDALTLINATFTHYGFTGHEHMDDVGLIHMNGRVYDPKLGRFLSADPSIQAPNNSQNYNRYSYVLNNPLSLTDPSGFNFLGNFLDHATGFLDHYVMPYIPAVIVIAASSLDPFLGAAVASAMYGPKAGWSALAASFLFNAVGDYVPEYSWSVPKIVAHGVVGGITSEIGGGKFSDGFWAAAFAKASGYMGGTDGIVRRALVGGVTSELGGGKFENGAITAAMGYLYGEAAKGKDKLPGRSLTSDERALAKKAFTKAFGSDDGFNYDSVRIIDGKYVFWQGDNYVVTPNGNIYWPHECGNLAKCGGAFGSRDQLQVASTFVHEMTHVLQYQQGTNVLLKGIFVQLGYFMGFNNPYVLPIDLPYNQMNIEQQAQYVRYQLYPDTVITK